MVITSKHVCYLCKRKFRGEQLLVRHEKLSELHQANLEALDQDTKKRKDELRQAVAVTRRQIAEVDRIASEQVVQDDVLAEARTFLEMQLRQLCGEYSSAQEKVEARYPNGQEVPAECAKEIRIGNLLLSSGASTWQGNKEMQEDRYVLGFELQAPGPDGGTIAGYTVCDGHSGSLCVEAVVSRLPDNIQKCLEAKQSLSEETLRTAVTEAVKITDDDFLTRARALEVLDGSTMILALFWDDGQNGDGPTGTEPGVRERMLICNIGDSRAVLGRADPRDGRPKALRLSEDHKPERSDERRRIEANGGVVDLQGVWRVFTPGMANFGGRELRWGLAVSRAFGDLLLKEPKRYGCPANGELVSAVPEISVYDIDLQQDRFAVLGCDGIWDVFEDRDAVAACIDGSPPSPGMAAHALVRRSFELCSDDNITALIIAWRYAPAEEQAPPSAAPSEALQNGGDEESAKRQRKE